MKMNLLMAFLLFVGFADVYCNCGCLTCSKHLRVVSPPSAPCKIIQRGYSCKCPNSIPYAIEIPKPVCRTCPTRSYDYKIEAVDFAKPIDPKYSYTYDVQVPVKKDCSCKYLYNLVATPDRIVLPAVDDCIPEKPTCPGPIIEYLPRYDEEVVCTRSKRDITFNSIIPSNSAQRKKPSKRFPIIKRKPLDKPFRVSIPLKRRFFPLKKPKIQGKEAVVKLRPQTNFISDKSAKELERKRHVEVLENWGKFADVPNVEIQDTFVLPLKNPTRKTRSLAFDEDSYPFYKISEATGEVGDDGFEDDSESVLKSKLMRPLDFENLLPHTPFFYLINAPIRALNHFHKLRHHVSPVVKSVPVVVDTSSGYLANIGKKLGKVSLDILGSLTKSLPAKDFLDLLGQMKRGAREKRTIFKVVGEDDVHEFLREKLSLFSDEIPAPNEDFLTPVTLKTVQNFEKANAKPKKKLVVEKLLPKLTFDKGKPFVDVNGIKKPIPVRQKPLSSISKSVPEDLKGAIANLIVEAKSMGPSGKYEDIEMPLQIIKEKVSQILDQIEKLIDANFDDNGRIYEELLRLQILKGVLVDHWKAILINKKHNDIGEKIRVLNSIHEIQSIKDRIVGDIVVALLGGDNFDSQNLIKLLVRLQKLQCVLVRIVEDFGERIRLRTPFDIQKEIKYVDYLEEMNLIAGKNNLEVGDELRKERDAQIGKHMNLLDNLKSILSKAGDEGFSGKIDEVAKQLWEVRNLEKLQREMILELDDKLQAGQKIRRELKILFDLQKQLELCEDKQKVLFKDALGKNEIKAEGVASSKSKKLKILKFGGKKAAPPRWVLKGIRRKVRDHKSH